jgi:16S rRNA (cytidine1402-2'-O)-methyltransferase
MAATLYLVATPIGNLEDVTYRAVRVLREAALIACEDTRQTRKLLDRYGIHTPTISYHEHNEAERAEQLLGKLREGTTVALVSDAGTPLVSDPGYRLVVKAIENGIRVEPAPGPSALLASLTASGLPAGQFHFAGFLPAKSRPRREALERLKDEEATLVFYEAPHRILKTLEDVEAVLGARPAVVAREVTKLHEEFLRGTPTELRQALQARPSIKGEITLLVGKARQPAVEDTPLPQAVEECVRAGMTRMEAIKSVARRRGLPKRQVYKAFGTRTFGPAKE